MNNMKYLYRIYQICVALPVALVATIITALTVAIGCSLGGGTFSVIIQVGGGQE